MKRAGQMTNHKYKVHPVASLFPMMESASFAALKADIQEHGQREDITLWKGLLIDGRNRLKACLELGIEPQICEMDPEFDPVPVIISLNLHRRHLDPSQRAMVAAALANLKRGQVGNGRKVEGQNCPSTDQASELLSVSPRLTKSAKVVLAGGSKELQNAVKSGEVSVSKAEKLVKRKVPKDQQLAEAKKPRSKPKPKPKPTDAEAELKRLQSVDIRKLSPEQRQLHDREMQRVGMVVQANKLKRMDVESDNIVVAQEQQRRAEREARRAEFANNTKAGITKLFGPTPDDKPKAKIIDSADTDLQSLFGIEMAAGVELDYAALAIENLNRCDDPAAVIVRWLQDADHLRVLDIYNAVGDLLDSIE